MESETVGTIDRPGDEALDEVEVLATLGDSFLRRVNGEALIVR